MHSNNTKWHCFLHAIKASAGTKHLVKLGLLLVVPLTTIAADISGKVSDENNKPIPFATVNLKGSQQVVATDQQGLFTLQSTLDSIVIIISSIGYETKEIRTAMNSGFIDVRLKTISSELANVDLVSSGYQDIPRDRSTGSFIKIDNAVLNQQTGTNILKRLDGVTSGLLFTAGKQNNNPQNKTNLTIRGLSTINGPLDPLVVLDGFIYEGDINNINPNDIESVTVLKDAAAASIWGARAGNGVIIITSKKARLNQKLQVSVNASLLVTEKPDLFYLKQMSSKDYIETEKYLFNQGYFDGQISSNPYSALSPAVEIFYKRQQGLITAEDSAAAINTLAETDSRHEYLRYFYRPAITRQYALNLRGGSVANSYLFSAAFDQNDAADYGNSRKINLGITNNFNPFKGLQASIRAYYTNNIANGGRGVQYGSVKPGGRDVPYLRFADKNGNPVPVAINYSERYTDTAGGGILPGLAYYPLTDFNYRHQANNLQELFALTTLRYQFNKWLAVDLGYQFQRQWSEQTRVDDPESFSARSLIQAFAQTDILNGNASYPVPNGSIKNSQYFDQHSATARAQLSVNHIAGVHQLTVISGAENRQTHSGGGQYTLYGYQEDPLSFTAVDFVNYYPTRPYGSFERISGAPSEYPTLNNRFVSFYSNGSYTYKSRYTISGSMRRDGSNILGATTNDKWKPLWSAGASWKISREPFYKFRTVPQVAIRVTYGYSGNIDLSRTANAIAVYYSGAPVTNLPVTRIQTLNNPSLKWEQISMFNAAIDLNTASNRLSGTVEYYLKRGTDLYGSSAFDYTAWGLSNTVVRNVASMIGKGADLTINSINTRGAVVWTSTLLFSYNKNKTTRYDTEGAKNILSILGGGATISPLVGKPLYAVAAYRWAGLDATGNPRGYVEGKPSTDYVAIEAEATANCLNGNIIYMGPAAPVYFGSLINRLSWKGISVSANIAYRGGYYFKSNALSYSALVNQGSGSSDFARRWQKPGDELYTNVPSLPTRLTKGEMAFTHYQKFMYTKETISESSI